MQQNEFVQQLTRPQVTKKQGGQETDFSPQLRDCFCQVCHLWLAYRPGHAAWSRLKPENDSHYAGKGVKLGTPERPIFWYKPAGADKYRVIYADLSVKELTPEEVKKLPEAKAK